VRPLDSAGKHVVTLLMLGTTGARMPMQQDLPIAENMAGSRTMAKDILTAQEIKAIRLRNELVSKWGADTISRFTRNIKVPKHSDYVCLTALTVCSTYSNAVMGLLRGGLKMPAKALLRILFEVSAKVLWCLNQPEADETGSGVEEKIQRWRKTALEQGIKLRERIVEMTSGAVKDRNKEALKALEEQSAQLSCKQMPDFVCLTKQLGGLWPQEFYTRLYAQFLDAVHLDFASLAEKARDDGHTVHVTCDSDESIEELVQYCTVDLHILFFAIRSHYGWDTNEMDGDFKAMKQSDDA